MNKWIIYLLGIMTGILLTFAFAFFANKSNDSGISGLEMTEGDGECVEYTQFKVFQVLNSGCALANADDHFITVFLIPHEGQQFYDDQKITLNHGQSAYCVGTYKYESKGMGEKTVPAIRIMDNVESAANEPVVDKRNDKMTLFDEPGECISRKDFEVQEVLPSGDAVAMEINKIISDCIFKSDLKVLILADEDSHFYNHQIIKTPKGKCARQIGTYIYAEYGDYREIIPIVSFK